MCIYKPDGKVKQTLKSPNPDARLFVNPRCVTVNHDGTIIVSDFAAHKVMLFDPEGNLKVTYGTEGTGQIIILFLLLLHVFLNVFKRNAI